MLDPLPLPYDIGDWQRRPRAERVRMVCQAWALQGYGAPLAIYGFYLIKVGLFIAGWWLFCSTSPGLGELATIESWWLAPVAFQKAVLWSVLFEVLGLGCGSGPLTGRYLPPLGGALYFARPGTTKAPLWPRLPVLGGARRSLLDVALYLALLAALIRALVAATIEIDHLAPVLVLLPLLGVADRTVFLAARSEHYLAALVCFAFPGDWIAGSKLVWLAIWWWAASSKLNRHFPSVIAVMISNSPLTRALPGLRRRMYRDYPRDLRPSRLATAMAHAGTAIEYAFPLVLVLSPGGPATDAALVTMLAFHLFVTSCVPMGVPIEWNVTMVYGAFFLFGRHAEVSALSIDSPLLAVCLAAALALVPLLGNLVPRLVSFLPAMRYYAGNWAYSVWLFRDQASAKLDRLTGSSPRVSEQLRRLYDEDTVVGLLSMVVAFRSMHLHGRALHDLLPRAVDTVDDLDRYEAIDGELVAGVVLGWNFGDGHLHDRRLLEAIQRQCGFTEGELRCVFVEAQPLFGRTLAWTIADAATGVLERGEIEVAALLERQPWPEAE